VPVRDGAFAGGAFDFLSPPGLLCGLGLVGGHALLGAGWLIWKTTGPTQIFGREIGRAALIATMAMMALVSLWTALTQPVILERWFDGSSLFAQALLPIAAIAAAVVLWQKLWGQQDGLPFVIGLVLFQCGFGGLAVSLWPYVVPRQITIWQAAGDLKSLRILGVGRRGRRTRPSSM
jgi:cytochrome bd ubiquinol oxidase subunit II